MEINERLLEDARVARVKVSELEQEVEGRRLEYYQAVRRLHSSGASMRDIAGALELSHQRVHQIVNGGGQVAPSKVGTNLLERLVRRGGKRCEPGQTSPGSGDHLLDRFYVDARTAMSLAQEEARSLRHHYIGTEHLLLGLLRTEHGLAARLLTAFGVDLERTRDSVEGLIGRGEGPSPGPLPATPRVKKALELARQEAKSLHSSHIRSEHVLLGLAREGGGVAARILADRGVGYEELRRRIDRAALACSFCGKSGLDVTHLIAGPGVYICEGCTRDASLVADEGEIGTPRDGLRIVSETQAGTCSFCGKRQQAGGRLIEGPDARICTDCLVICREIQEQERSTLAAD